MYKACFVFSKKGEMKYISHLDLMRLFTRALRRSGLPIKITEGFHPHPKFSIKRALKLGLESENEEAQVVLREWVDLKVFQEKLGPELPQGIQIKSVAFN